MTTAQPVSQPVDSRQRNRSIARMIVMWISIGVFVYAILLAFSIVPPPGHTPTILESNTVRQVACEESTYCAQWYGSGKVPPLLIQQLNSSDAPAWVKSAYNLETGERTIDAQDMIILLDGKQYVEQTDGALVPIPVEGDDE